MRGSGDSDHSDFPAETTKEVPPDQIGPPEAHEGDSPVWWAEAHVRAKLWEP